MSRLKYRERSHQEMERAVYSPDLKNLVNDVAFLTDKGMRDDVVIYAGEVFVSCTFKKSFSLTEKEKQTGSNIGHWFPIVARMFPTMHFLVYDGNPVKLEKMSQNAPMPANVSFKHAWFNESEAKRYARTGIPHVGRDGILLIADSNNLDWDKENPGPVIKNLNKDLADQVF